MWLLTHSRGSSSSSSSEVKLQPPSSSWTKALSGVLASPLAAQVWNGPLGKDTILWVECTPQHNSMVNMITLACFFLSIAASNSYLSSFSQYFLPNTPFNPRRVCNLPLKELKSWELLFKGDSGPEVALGSQKSQTTNSSRLWLLSVHFHSDNAKIFFSSECDSDSIHIYLWPTGDILVPLHDFSCLLLVF